MAAIRADAEHALNALIAQGVDLQQHLIQGESLIFTAVEHRAPRALEILLAEGLDADEEFFSRSPIEWAAFSD